MENPSAKFSMIAMTEEESIMIEKMSMNTTIQVSKLTKNKLKELKYDLRVESYEEVIKKLIESYKVKTNP